LNLEKNSRLLPNGVHLTNTKLAAYDNIVAKSTDTISVWFIAVFKAITIYRLSGSYVS